MNLSNYSKAIAGFLAVVVLGLLKQYNILPDTSVADAVQGLLGGVITGIVIWLSPKNTG